ncbi:hypothetical protein [Flaviaesturariibacter amylovorans]|uniref:Uncharacterized protein n=1 Tax=Flaviaesturariibacter amylovorans TaxID=1084520 RepID=A0ABP8HVJ8_9BACT
MGLDLAHYIPVKSGDPFDGYELIEQGYFDANPELFAQLRDYVDNKSDGIWYLYHRELGEQRKGMERKFYRRFKPGYYLERKWVEEAFTYLESDHLATLEELKTNFKANFIDNFQEGKSVFYVSY